MAVDILGSILDKISFGDKRLLGVDIGGSAIKIAEVDKLPGDNYKIIKYTSIPLVEGTIIDNEIQNPDEVLKALRAGFKKIKSGRRNVCIGLSGPGTALKKLQMPDGQTEDEREEQAQWDVEQYLPFPVEEGNVSSSVARVNPGTLTDVLVGAAKKDLVNSFKSLVEKANVKVRIVDLSAAAIMNVFELVMKEKMSDKTANWL